MSVSISCDMLMRSLMARSMRTRPMRYWFSISSPTARTRRLPRWSMSSTEPRPFFSSMRWRTVSRMSCGVSTCEIERGAAAPRAGPVELVVQLEAADLREVVALGVEEQVVEERLRRLERRRITRAQAPVDLHDRVFGRLHLVGEQRVAQVASRR